MERPDAVYYRHAALVSENGDGFWVWTLQSFGVE